MKKSLGSNIISDNNSFNRPYVDKIIEHLIILKNQVIRHCWPCWNFAPTDIITSTLPANKLTNQFKTPSKFNLLVLTGLSPNQTKAKVHRKYCHIE